MIRVIFSESSVDFDFPTSWADFNQKQLRYVFYALSTYNRDEAKFRIFCRLFELTIIRYNRQSVTLTAQNDAKREFSLSMGSLVSVLSHLDFLFQPNRTPVRLDAISAQHDNKRVTFEAVHPGLQGVPFRDYLSLENYYQGFLRTKNRHLLRSMLALLYRHESHSLADTQFIVKPWLEDSVLLWYASIKNALADTFEDFFGDVDTSSPSAEMPNFLKIMNAQIRALTGGDITKEETILNMDCWRALTELNEKSREAREWRQKYGRD